MAIVKSKRNVAKGTLDYLDKKELVATYLLLNKEFNDYEEDVKKQIGTYESELKSLKLKVKEESDRVEQLQRSLTLFVTDENVKREILRLYAKGNSTINIHKVLNETKKISVEYEVINDIITNLKNRDLPIEDLDFYAKEVKFHLENNSNQEEELRISQIRQLEENQNSINDIIAEVKKNGIPENFAETTNVFIQLMKEKRANADSMAKLLKGSSDSIMTGQDINSAKEMKEKINNHANRILNNFNPNEGTMVVV